MIFYPLKNYEGFYLISKCGKIKSLQKSNRLVCGFISINTTKSGYKCVRLCKNKTEKNHNIHRLLAINFIENPYNKPCVNHIDGNKLNNDLSNLEWVTYSENNKHAYKTGLKSNYGEKQSRSKLKEKDVIYIKNSNELVKDLSIKFCVTVQNIYDIKKGKSWKHIINSTQYPLTEMK